MGKQTQISSKILLIDESIPGDGRAPPEVQAIAPDDVGDLNDLLSDRTTVLGPAMEGSAAPPSSEDGDLDLLFEEAVANDGFRGMTASALAGGVRSAPAALQETLDEDDDGSDLLGGSPTPPPARTPAGPAGEPWARQQGELPLVAAAPPLATAPGPRVRPFTRLKSNVKGITDIELGPCTVLIGPNRAGKTKGLSAAMLALTASHPVSGKDDEIFNALAPEGTKELFATIEGPDGTLTYRIQKKSRGEGFKKHTHEATGDLAKLPKADLERAVPALAVAELLGGMGAARAREAIFKRFAGGVKVAAPRFLDADQKALWDKAMAAVKGEDDVEKASEACGWLRAYKAEQDAQKRTLAAEIERRRTAAEAVGDVSEVAVTAAEKRLDTARLYERFGQARARRADVAAKLAAAKQEAAALPALPAPVVEPIPSQEDIAQIKALEAQAEKHAAAARAKSDMIVVARDRLRVLEKAQGCQSCPTCSTPGVDLVAPRDRYVKAIAGAQKAMESEIALGAAVTQKADAIRKRVEETNARTTAAGRAEMTRVQGLRTAAGNGLRGLTAELTGIDATLASVPADPGITAADAEAHLTKLREIRVQLSDLQNAGIKQKAAETLADRAGRLSDEAGKMLTALLSTVKGQAEAAVNEHMPAAFRAALTLQTPDGKPSCRWEVVGMDGRPHRKHAASGAEFSILANAVGNAWTAGAPIQIPILDDADLGCFTPEGLTQFLATIQAKVKAGELTQSIIALNRSPEAIPPGWTVIRLPEPVATP